MAQVRIKQIQGLGGTLSTIGAVVDDLTNIVTIRQIDENPQSSSNTNIFLSSQVRTSTICEVLINGIDSTPSFTFDKDGVIYVNDGSVEIPGGSLLIFDSGRAGYDIAPTDRITLVYESGTIDDLPDDLANGIFEGTQYDVAGVQYTGISGTVTGDLIPGADVTYDLGSPDKRFKDLYLSGNTLYMGGQPLSIVNGQLTLNGTPVSGNTDTWFSGHISNHIYPQYSMLDINVSFSSIDLSVGAAPGIFTKDGSCIFNSQYGYKMDYTNNTYTLISPPATSGQFGFSAWRSNKFSHDGNISLLSLDGITFNTAPTSGNSSFIVKEYNATTDTWSQMGSTQTLYQNGVTPFVVPGYETNNYTRRLFQISLNGEFVYDTKGYAWHWDGVDWQIEDITNDRTGFRVSSNYNGDLIVVNIGDHPSGQNWSALNNFSGFFIYRRDNTNGTWNLEYTGLYQNPTSYFFAGGFAAPTYSRVQPTPAQISGDGSTVVYFADGSLNTLKFNSSLNSWILENTLTPTIYTSNQIPATGVDCISHNGNRIIFNSRVFEYDTLNAEWIENFMVSDFNKTSDMGIGSITTHTLYNSVNSISNISETFFLGQSSSDLLIVDGASAAGENLPRMYKLSLPAVGSMYDNAYTLLLQKMAHVESSDPNSFLLTNTDKVYSLYFPDVLLYKPGQLAYIRYNTNSFIKIGIISNQNSIIEFVVLDEAIGGSSYTGSYTTEYYIQPI